MKKNKNRKGRQRTKIINKATSENARKPMYKRISSFFLWLAAIGILPVIVSFILDFLTGDVQIKEIKPSGRGYEFTLVNNSSTDQIIEEFRISPDFDQNFIFKIDAPVYAEVTKNGITIPGGNSTYMPAFEYKDMNGYVLHSKTELNFRIPPLVARNYMIPESIVVFVDYSTKSNNNYMRKIENFLSSLKLRDTKKKKKYLVVENYWTPLGRNSQVNAIKNACRDDDIFAKSEICKQ